MSIVNLDGDRHAGVEGAWWGMEGARRGWPAALSRVATCRISAPLGACPPRPGLHFDHASA